MRLNRFQAFINLIRLRSGVIASLLSLIESKRVLRTGESPSDSQIYLVSTSFEFEDHHLSMGSY